LQELRRLARIFQEAAQKGQRSIHANWGWPQLHFSYWWRGDVGRGRIWGIVAKIHRRLRHNGLQVICGF
jgi:hypothetical protein